MSGQNESRIRKSGRAAVVVLGDIGRSPRMQYHALSLARQAHLEVDIVAYGGSDPHSAVKEHNSVHIHEMTQWPSNPKSLPKILRPLLLIFKPLVQFFMLLWYLCVKIPAPDVFIVQNPPSVPTLVAVKLASWIRRSAFVIDWHNFGYTLLALSLGRNSRFVALYHWIEKYFGKMANGSLCVTRAMQHELAQNWGISATVLYDQPPEFFRPSSLEEKHKVNYLLHEKASLRYTSFNPQVSIAVVLQEFRRQVDRDCEFLEQEGVMDYSLLVGIHFREAESNGDQTPSGSRTPNDNGGSENETVPRLSRADMDQLLLDQAGWASIKLGINMPARVERTERKPTEAEIQLIGEPTGELYDVILFFGIIDILQDYDITKKLEHAYKSMQCDPNSISAVDPRAYSRRFRDYIFKAFIEDN